MLKSKPQEQTKIQEQPKGQATLSAAPSGRGEASPGSFSVDPSPFTQRPVLDPESSAYRELVAIAAYYRAERRGFVPGSEIEDWLDAEREVAARIHERRTV